MEDISKFTEGGLRFITHHGDENFSKRKPEDVLWKNGDQTKYNVILFGDKHNVTIKETKDATMIGLPSLSGK
jgi:predicted phosphodiesterase